MATAAIAPVLAGVGAELAAKAVPKLVEHGAASLGGAIGGKTGRKVGRAVGKAVGKIFHPFQEGGIVQGAPLVTNGPPARYRHPPMIAYKRGGRVMGRPMRHGRRF